MQTATAPEGTRQKIESALVQKCWKDPVFRKEVVSDPKGMLEKHLGQKLPEQVKIFIHEEDANTLHLSIPPAPSNLTELSDEDLQKVAGGTDVVTVTLVVAQITISLGIGAAVGVTVGGAAGSLIGTAVANDKLW